MNQLIIQGIGVLALICSLISFQQKKRIWLMIFHMSASILSAIQLFLLGAYAGAVLDLIAFMRTLIFSFGNRVMRMGLGTWRAIFLGQMLLAGALTFTDIYSLLAVLAGCLSTIALSMKKDFHVRLISLFVSPCWIVYNIVYGAYAGIVNELIAVVSIVIGIYRNDIKKKDELHDESCMN